jgi:hypothetical protein
MNKVKVNRRTLVSGAVDSVYGDSLISDDIASDLRSVQDQMPPDVDPTSVESVIAAWESSPAGPVGDDAMLVKPFPGHEVLTQSLTQRVSEANRLHGEFGPVAGGIASGLTTLDPTPEGMTGGTAFDIGQMAGTMAAFTLPGNAIKNQILNGLSRLRVPVANRITGIAASSLESAITDYGYTMAESRGDATESLERAKEGALLTGAFETVGRVLGLVARKVGLNIPGVAPKRAPDIDDPPLTYRGEVKDPTIDNPFETRTIDEWHRMNQGLELIAKREGIPVYAVAVRPHDFLPGWMYTRAQQHSAMAPWLESLDTKIDRSFQAWGDRIVTSMAETPVLREVNAGQYLQHNWQEFITGHENAAKRMYDMVEDEIGHVSVNVHDLRIGLESLIQDQVPSAGVNRIQRHLNNTFDNPQVSFSELWSLVKSRDGFKVSHKGSIDADDRLLIEAAGLVRKEMTQAVELLSPTGGAGLMASANRYWKKTKDWNDSRIGKIMSDDASVMVENLTKRPEIIEELRDEMGPAFANMVARQRINMLMKAALDEQGKLDYQRLHTAVQGFGGDLGIYSESFEVLMQDAPDQLKALQELYEVARMYHEPRRHLQKIPEVLGSGVEKTTLATLARHPMDLLLLITHWSSGGTLARALGDVGPGNPFVRRAGEPGFPMTSGTGPILPTARRVVQGGSRGVDRIRGEDHPPTYSLSRLFRD